MRVKATQRLTIEDIPKDQRAWMEKIVASVNDYVTQSIKILNDGIVFPDNFIGKDHVFDFVFQTNVISLPIGFLWLYGAAPKSLQVVSATESGDPVNISVAWRFTEDRQVELTEIVKFTTAPVIATLTATKRYKIRVRVTP